MEIKCEYSTLLMSNDYKCNVKGAQITEPNTKITSISGEHKQGHSFTDVRYITFNRPCIINYFPRGLIKLFPYLQSLSIVGCGLKEISRADLLGLGNLESMYLSSNDLRSLPSDLFMGMLNLKYISFANNDIECMSSELLKPIAGNGLQSVNFSGNPKIDAFYCVHSDNVNKTKSLKELMEIIDKSCDEPDAPAENDKNFPITCTAAYEELWTSKRYADFTIIAGVNNPKKFAVHKSVLGPSSSVFAAVFEHDMKEKQSGVMKIEDSSSAAVENFLEFIYTGKIKEETNAMELYELACKYDISALKSLAELIICRNTNASNAQEVFALGLLHNSESIKKAAYQAK
jgi:BTB/POZ domain/Leucine rich repeat